MRFLRKPFRIIRANLRAYLIINASTFGLFLAGFVVGLIFPDLTQAQTASLEEDGTGDLVRSLITNPWLFAVTILGVNVVRLSALTIVLPSFVIPFAGIALFAYWTLTTGVTLVPTTELAWVALIPHSLTAVIELQAYVLLVLGAYLLGKYWLRPHSVGAQNRRQGYLRGLQQLGWLSLPAFTLLIIGAIWEAFSLIYLVHPLSTWLL